MAVLQDFIAYQGSTFTSTITLASGNINGYTANLVIGPYLSLNSSNPTASGSLNINGPQGTIQITISGASTYLYSPQRYYLSLTSPNTSSVFYLLNGQFNFINPLYKLPLQSQLIIGPTDVTLDITDFVEEIPLPPPPLPPPESSYDIAILNDGPVAYLPLYSQNALDYTGNNHNGTAFAAPTTTTFPNGDTILDFNGATQYIEIPSDPTLGVPETGILTIEAWMRPDTLQFPNEEGSGYVYWMGKNMQNESEWSCRMYSTTNTEVPPRPNRISGYAFNLTGGLGVGAYFQDPVTAGQWIYYTLIINTVNTSATYPTGYVTIYKNGVYRNQQSLSNLSIVPMNGTAPVRIGTASLNSFFEGAIGKVGIYNYELSPVQIRNHYQLIFPPVQGSVQWLSNAGTASATVSGTALPMTISNAGVSAGSTLIVRTSHSYTAGAPTIADSKGNVYTRNSTAPNAAQTMRTSLFSAPINNALQQGDAILLTTAGSTGVRTLTADAFSGITFLASGGNYVSPIDKINSTSNAGSTNPGTTIPITTVSGNDLIIGTVGVFGPSSQGYTEDTLEPWQTLTRVGTTGGPTNITLNSAFQSVGSTAQYFYRPTLGTSASWIEIIGSYIAGDSTPHPTPGGTAAFIQNIGTAIGTTSGNKLIITVPDGGVVQGHTLFIKVLHDYTTGAPTAIDSRGNTYTRDRTAADGALTIRTSIFSAPINTALQAGDLITVTLSASVTTRVATIDEFYGVLTPTVIDKQNGLAGTSAAPSLPSTNTSNANDLILSMVAVAGDVSDAYTEDVFNQWTGLTRVGTTGGTFANNRTMNSAYRAVGATGNYTYAPTLGTSSLWIEFVMSYEA